MTFPIIAWLYKLFYSESDKKLSAMQLELDLANKDRIEFRKLYMDTLLAFNLAMRDKEKMAFETIGNIKIPNLSKYMKNKNTIDPRVLLKQGSFVADLIYDTLPKEDFVAMLTIVRNLFYEQWQSEKWDCDNFASFMTSLVQYSYYKSGSIRQVAFGYANSDTHAYNFFIDNDSKVWIYEPQSNTVVGLIGLTKAPYNTTTTQLIG